MAQSAELFAPLYDLLIKRVRGSSIIWTDDTTVPVWDPTLPKTRTGRFWVYLGDSRNPYCVYDFTPRRSRDGPERFLEGFRGYLQADAFGGYDRVCAGANVIRVACWAHARRKFDEARTTAPLLAHVALARIQQLYRIEKACANFSAEERRVIRLRDAVPLLNAIEEWLDEQSRKTLPKSPIGKAISYARAQWEDLQTYTHDGELSIDNNLSPLSLLLSSSHSSACDRRLCSGDRHSHAPGARTVQNSPQPGIAHHHVVDDHKEPRDQGEDQEELEGSGQLPLAYPELEQDHEW